MPRWILTWSKLLNLEPLSSLLYVPEVAGVYRLSYRSSDGKIYVFYVGKATNLKRRINQHLSPEENNLCIKKMLTNYSCFVRYARVENENIRDGAEAFLYSYYSPSCNIDEPLGKIVDINTE